MQQLLKEQHHIYQLICKISNVADKRSLQCYLVGGVVRDILLGIKNKDIDIVVVGDGLAFADAVSDELKAYPVVKFKEFGTAMIPLENFDLEIATARKEVYQNNSRNPEVRASDLKEDLKRRDFTVNSMAISINKDRFGEFIDPFGGVRDLENKRIITPLDPKETFFEDPLRMLRAVRFAARLDFNIDPVTFFAIKEYAGRIHIVSNERIRDEFFKIITARAPSRGILMLEECGLLTELFPEMHDLRGVEAQEGHKHKDVYYHTLKVLDNIAAFSDDPDLRLAALFHDIAKPRTKRFRQESGWTFYGR
ncbi:MAG: CCA tRNA nucleotidyltransferase [Candidatus Marinimicrobia bacterium]|nr:CCA tRNA nucleotidyltransferase [Candidatus Neomarinimicrobiota bacterium]